MSHWNGGRFRGSPFHKFFCMINSIEATESINRFIDVRIPSARDLFYRYGSRVSANGSYSSNGEHSQPCVMTNSVIGQIVQAENHLKSLPKNDK